jgi:lysophospholipase L1-like esterase
VTADTDYVIIAGSRNDSIQSAEAVMISAVQTIGVIQQKAPNATIIVIGPMWAGDEEPEAAPIEEAVEAAAVSSGVVWVDGSSWFDGHTDLIASDRIHPTDAGHEHLAALIDEALAPTFG